MLTTGNQLGIGMADRPMGECKPDPEEMLQRARHLQVYHKQAREHLYALEDLPIHLPMHGEGMNSLQYLLGYIDLQMRALDKEIEKWLKEMDE